MAVEQYSVVAHDWVNLEFIINDLTQRVVGQELHPTSAPTFADITLTGDLNITGDVDIGGTLTLDGLTASRLVATDASKGLESVDLVAWVAGTANQVVVADDADGSITLSTPQDIHTGASPTWVNNTLTGYLDLAEISEPSTPAANNLRLYVEDIQGFSFFKYLDSTGMKREIVRDSMIIVYNNSGSDIVTNRVVYASGSTGSVPTVALAKSNSLSTMPAIGVTIEGISNNSYGRVMQVGLLENLNTSSLSVGDVLYVHDTIAGLVRITPPVTPALIQEVGTVLVDDASVGAIQIISRSMRGNEYGTIQNSFSIGNGAAGSKTLTFNAASDVSLVWDETNLNIGGPVTFNGTARINWTKIAANGVTLTNYTSADSVSDLQTDNDGNTYTCTEVAGGNNHLVVDFTGVTAFNWLRCLAYYDGNAIHNVVVQIEITPFDGSTWHTLDSIEHQGATTNTMQDHSFFIPSDTAYINSGVVKVRFLHSAATTAGHTFVIDECSLYQ
jgi:hypothetical protein